MITLLFWTINFYYLAFVLTLIVLFVVSYNSEEFFLAATLNADFISASPAFLPSPDPAAENLKSKLI